MFSSNDAKRSFVRTYKSSVYDDIWNLVEDYELVQGYAAQYPKKGSSAVSSALDLPRERIRSWVDGEGRPDCYRGLQTALSNGWIIDSWDEESAQALNCLAAWVLSSGGINERFVPTFVTDSDSEYKQLRDYAASAGIRLKRTRDPDGERPPEWRPSSDASVLGRVLYTWTGIKGDKSREATKFPEYLNDVPEPILRSYLQVYAQQRGVYRDDRGEYIQIIAERTDGFRRVLKSHLQSVVENPEEVKGDGWPIRIYGDAMKSLRQYPKIKTS